MRKWLPAVMAAALALWGAAPAKAQDEETIIDWAERIHVTGTVETDFTWADKSDPADGESASASDLFISTVELGVEVEFTEAIFGNLLLLKEDIGTPDETEMQVDEAMMILQNEEFPAYLAVGKRVQPFGVYENHLLADPLTEDAYETNRPGVTEGITGPMGLDVSLTFYKGEEMMAHLFESGLFDAEAVQRGGDPDGADETQSVNSYILSATVVPIEEMLTVFGGYISEPGRGGERNTTGSAGFSLGLGKFRFDAEYMAALRREKYEVTATATSEEFKESVLSLSAAYEFVLREREVIGGALFAQRKAHSVLEPLEVAVRYEVDDDDIMAQVAQSQSVESRLSTGGRYSFYSDEESGLAAFVGLEYLHTEYDLHPTLAAALADSNDEVIVRLGVTF